MRERRQKGDCPHCQHWDSTVIQGWPDPRGYTRRRKCAKCLKTYKTREVPLIGVKSTTYRLATS
jgi:transcriptional regulator NrdR family protein